MVGGTLLTLTDGPDGVISAPGLGVSTDNVALLGDEVDLWVDPDVGTPDLFVNDFKVSVTADSLNGKDVFVGVGPAVEVREYIGDADPDRFRVVNDDLEIVQGSGQDPLAPPAGEDFWTATNADGTFEWRPTTGEWAIVVLNADGSAGIDTILDVEATIPVPAPGGSDAVRGRDLRSRCRCLPALPRCAEHAKTRDPRSSGPAQGAGQRRLSRPPLQRLRPVFGPGATALEATTRHDQATQSSGALLSDRPLSMAKDMLTALHTPAPISANIAGRNHRACRCSVGSRGSQ